jgi:hypothetical protein
VPLSVRPDARPWIACAASRNCISLTGLDAQLVRVNT